MDNTHKNTLNFESVSFLPDDILIKIYTEFILKCDICDNPVPFDADVIMDSGFVCCSFECHDGVGERIYNLIYNRKES